MRKSTTNPGEWLQPEWRVWLDQCQYIVGGFDERGGLVLEQRRRGLGPVRRLLDPAELAAVLEAGRLRPVDELPEKDPTS